MRIISVISAILYPIAYKNGTVLSSRNANGYIWKFICSVDTLLLLNSISDSKALPDSV